MQTYTSSQSKCPNALYRSGRWVSCKRSRCRYCGHHQCRDSRRKTFSGLSNAPDGTQLYAGVFKLQGGDPLTSWGRLKNVSQHLKNFRDGMRRKGRYCEYLVAVHAHKSGEAHIHFFLALENGLETEVEKLKLGWEKKMVSLCGTSQRSYIKECRNPVCWVNYILFNNNKPWQRTWQLPSGVRRVRASSGFRISSPIPSRTIETRELEIEIPVLNTEWFQKNKEPFCQNKMTDMSDFNKIRFILKANKLPFPRKNAEINIPKKSVICTYKRSNLSLKRDKHTISVFRKLRRFRRQSPSSSGNQQVSHILDVMNHAAIKNDVKFGIITFDRKKGCKKTIFST